MYLVIKSVLRIMYSYVFKVEICLKKKLVRFVFMIIRYYRLVFKLVYLCCWKIIYGRLKFYFLF